MNKNFSIVVAMDSRKGIGRKQSLPWDIKEDMEYFRKLTTNCHDENKHNAVIMGRKTWESIPEKFRPLKGRLNIVLTKDTNYPLPEQVTKATNLDEALSVADRGDIEKCFVIGGGHVYKQALEHQNLNKIYATQIDDEFDCDTFFPDFENKFYLAESNNSQNEDDMEYKFNIYEKNNE